MGHSCGGRNLGGAASRRSRAAGARNLGTGSVTPAALHPGATHSVASPGVSPFPGVELQRATELGDEAHPNVNQEAYGQLFPHATLV